MLRAQRPEWQWPAALLGLCLVCAMAACQAPDEYFRGNGLGAGQAGSLGRPDVIVAAEGEILEL